MSYRANYYSDPSHDTDQQYLMAGGGRNRNGHPDSAFYRGETLPLRQMTNPSDVHPVKKRIGTLGKYVYRNPIRLYLNYIYSLLRRFFIEIDRFIYIPPPRFTCIYRGQNNLKPVNEQNLY